MSDTYQIMTPENVELDYEIAGIGTRFMAMAIDFIIQSLFTVALITILPLIGIDKLDLNHEMPNLNMSMFTGLIIILIFVVNFGYFILLETVMNGQTIGKKIMHIRVRQDGGGAPGVWEILLRNIIRIVEYLPVFYTIGVLVMFLNPKAKRLGDYAAGTIVVKELPRKKVRSILSGITESQKENLLFPSETDYPWIKSILPFVGQAEYLIIKNLLSRRGQLSNFPDLAGELLVKLISKSDLAECPDLNMVETVDVLKMITEAYEKTTF